MGFPPWQVRVCDERLEAMSEARDLGWKSVADAEAQGFVPIGYVVDPANLRKYIPHLLVRADGMCWARFPQPPALKSTA